jgi:hypothetical protein
MHNYFAAKNQILYSTKTIRERNNLPQYVLLVSLKTIIIIFLGKITIQITIKIHDSLALLNIACVRRHDPDRQNLNVWSKIKSPLKFWIINNKSTILLIFKKDVVHRQCFIMS